MLDVRLDRETRALLQIDHALEHFAGFAYSSLGAEAVRGRTAQAGTATDHAAAEVPVREMWSLYAASDAPPLAGLFDPRTWIEALRPDGSRVEPRGFLMLARFIDLAGPALRFGQTHAADTPWIAREVAGLEPIGDLGRAIRDIIDDEGLVRDRASARLAKIRTEQRSLSGQMQKAIQRLLRQHGQSGDLSDTFFTVRDDRYCLPVASSRRRSVAGITHGSSGSGETVYIEPIELVELSNQARELLEAEEEEVRRLLTELGATLRPHLPTLDRHVDIFARLDDAAARARAGWEAGLKLARLVEQRRVGWGDPEQNAFTRAAASAAGPATREAPTRDAGTLDIRSGHHALLYLGLGESKASVPIDLELRPRDRVLLLSGPNAGGKTTLLKTVGLLCWLAQAGFPVPLGADSSLPIVDHIGALIGDQQDTLAGDSTFSAHLKRLRRLLLDAGPGSLLLLDEIASGTDPTEGAPLAMAALEWLAWRGALVFASSHLGPLKEWANEFPPARNGSFALDEEHRPTFHLMLDVPGASEALLVAGTVGMPRVLLERARALIPEERAPVQALMASLQKKSREVEEQARAQAERAAQQEARAAELERREAEFRADKQTYRERMLREKLRDLRAVREEVERQVAALPPREGLAAGRGVAGEAHAAAVRDLKALEREGGMGAAVEDDRPLAEGRRVYVGPLRVWAEILRIDEARGRVRLDVDGTEVEMSLAQLSARAMPALAASELPPFDLGPILRPAPTSAPTQAPAAPAPEAAFLPKPHRAPPSAPSVSPGKSVSASTPPAADPLAAIMRVPGRGLFRGRQSETPPVATPEPSPSPAVPPSAGVNPSGPGKKKRANRKKGFSDDDFFESPLAKVRTKKRVAAPGLAKLGSLTPGGLSSAARGAPPPPPAPPQGGYIVRRAADSAAPPLTIDMHGMRVEEALAAVDNHINDALLSGYPYIRLMHGVGTGALRRAIGEHLRGHPSISKLMPAPANDGGDGVTIVEFR